MKPKFAESAEIQKLSEHFLMVNVQVRCSSICLVMRVLCEVGGLVTKLKMVSAMFMESKDADQCKAAISVGSIEMIACVYIGLCVFW